MQNFSSLASKLREEVEVTDKRAIVCNMAALDVANFSNFFLWIKKNLFRLGQKWTRVKGGSASYLLPVKSMVRAHLYFFQ